MNLGFSDQFLEYVREGSKTHTIRGGSRWRVGMRGDLFEKTRGKKTFDAEGNQIDGMRLVFRAKIVKVETIVLHMDAIHIGDGVIPEESRKRLENELKRQSSPKLHPMGLNQRTVDGVTFTILSEDETEAFAWRDGFRFEHDTVARAADPVNFEMMRYFWLQKHGKNCFPFVGQVVHWNFNGRSQEKGGVK